MNSRNKCLFAAFFAPLLGGPLSHAAEFEVLDRFSVDGYAVLKGSADIPGGSFTVGGSSFTVQYGKVGIGTADPSYGLEVIHTTGVHLSTTGTAGYGLYLNSAANVGIGTAEPVASLDVNGGIKVGTVTANCTTLIAGTLRWYDGHVSVCNGSNWRQLDNQPPPTVTGITPASGLYNLQTPITITGTGFSSGLELSIGGTPLATYVLTSALQITAVAPSGTVGAKDVKITNPDGQYITGTFTYNPLPTITGLTPTTGSGVGGTPVTITGTGFLSGAAVTIANISATSIVRLSDTQITAITPASTTSGVKDVKVTNFDTGYAERTGVNGFTYKMYATATGGGGNVDGGGYRTHTFTGSGTLTFATGGNVEVLVVAGGGGGGCNHAGGGGGGGVIYNSAYSVSAGTGYTVTVGAGGANAPAGGTSPSFDGGNSVFDSLTGIGGGGGGNRNDSSGTSPGRNGGSGGGGGGAQAPFSGCWAAGTGSQGYSGGTATNLNGGGGGGAGGSGSNGTGTAGSGNGGPGLSYPISGATYYAGGGGGSTGTATYVGQGGIGGGGTAGTTVGSNGTAGAANTGGGGGGGGAGTTPGSPGGSGIVIVRYPI